MTKPIVCIVGAAADQYCEQVMRFCAGTPVLDKTATATLVEQADGSWSVTGISCGGYGVQQVGKAAVTPVDAYAEVTKRVPVAAIGAAPGKGTTLVNIQTIFWVQTAAQRDLGTATLLGHKVALRIHAQSVAWDFGDGGTDSTGELGKAYSETDPCSTPQCPSYYGHTYTATSASRDEGRFRVLATVTWSGQFSVDGGAWRNIQNPAGGNTVQGAAATVPIKVVQARGVLVPDPSGR